MVGIYETNISLVGDLMNEEYLEEHFKQIVDALTKLFNEFIDAMKRVLELFKLDDPNFKYNYEMSRSSKKKRTRKKYAKRCFK